MKRTIIYTITGIICFAMSFNWSFLVKKTRERWDSNKTTSINMTPINATFINPLLINATPISTTLINATAARSAAIKAKALAEAKAKVKNITISRVPLKKVPFTLLPGWEKADLSNSLSAFQTSCKIFLKQKPTHPVGPHYLKLKAKDWHPACNAALAIESLSDSAARTFFEKWFHPIEFAKQQPRRSLFTGYYMPQLKGSLTRTKKYNTPIYGLPQSLKWGHQYTRREIDRGALSNKAPVLAWINSPVERAFLEIEGSGVIRLPSGKSLYLSYAGENGAHYTSISKVLINQGIMNRNNASKKAITSYLKDHPQRVSTILHQNKSFVFFQNLKQPVALGAQDINLTPGYSLAIDRKWIPLGAPLWLATKKPIEQSNKDKKFERLMIAQDTGGAIRGMVRGDVYWGAGKKAQFLGEHMKTHGRFWMLLPKHFFARLSM